MPPSSPKSSFEQLQALAKSTLASQIKDAINSAGSLASQKVEAVRGLLELAIRRPSAQDISQEIQGLAKSVLAYQIRDVVESEGMSAEEKVEHIRGMITPLVIDPGQPTKR